MEWEKGIDGYFLPGRELIMENEGAVKIICKLETSGSQSKIFLGNITQHMRDVGQEVVVKAYFRGRDISTVTSDFEEDTDAFLKNPTGIDEDEGFNLIFDSIDLYEVACYNEGRSLSHLNSRFPNLFPYRYGHIIHSKPSKGRVKYPPCRTNVIEYVSPTLDKVALTLSDETKTALVKLLFQSVYAMQSVGLVHKDLSLSNLLTRDNTLKISDFGSAHNLGFKDYKVGVSDVQTFMDSSEEYPFDASDRFLGNRLYRPPETYHGLISPRSDVWAAGLIAFSILTGEHLLPMFLDSSRIFSSTNISNEGKRLFEAGLDEILRRDRKSLQKYITERIMDDERLPKEYRMPILHCCRVSPNTRRNMVKILDTAGIPTPKKITKEPKLFTRENNPHGPAKDDLQFRF